MKARRVRGGREGVCAVSRSPGVCDSPGPHTYCDIMPLVVVIGWVEHDEPGRLALPMFPASWPDPVESMEPFWVAATTGRTLATAEICHLTMRS
jgi:hypothetical protein